MAKGRREAGESLVVRLSRSGRIEVVLAVSLAVLTVVLITGTGKPWPPLLLDCLACALAAVTPRWPRAAGVALGLVLASYLFIPTEWATMGEYALLIPILGSGMRGERTARAVMSGAYLVILAALTVQAAPNLVQAFLGSIVWAVLIGLLWLIGNVFVASSRAHEQARQTELVLQRQAVARELHDTVARSLTRVAMAAEGALLHGSATSAELELIADQARRSTQELRWVMTLLRDPANLDGLASTPTPLHLALLQGRAELAQHGLQATVSVTDGIEQLDPARSEALGAVTSEAISNMIKHADPSGPCAIIVDVSEDNAELVFLNRPRQDERASSALSLGLQNLRETLEPLGGSLHTERQPTQWMTRATLPMSASLVTPERVA